MQKSTDYIDQRAFASSILPHQCVHLSGRSLNRRHLRLLPGLTPGNSFDIPVRERTAAC